MEVLNCSVERITYNNPESGFSVLKCNTPGYRDLVPVVGKFPDIHVGCVLKVTGNWKHDAKYGKQFVGTYFEEKMPATSVAIKKYLGGGLVKGIGPVYAERIVDVFGEKTLDVIENEPDKLLKISGIGEKRIEKIITSWNEQKEIREIIMFLQRYGIHTGFAVKIYKTYKKKSISVIKQNPYRLADDIWGIGFKTADGIAEKLGFSKDNPLRIRSGLYYVLNLAGNTGHCYLTREELLNSAQSHLEVDVSLIENIIDSTIAENNLINDDGDIYLPPFYYAEENVAVKLKNLYLTPTERNVKEESFPAWIKKVTGIDYDEVQIHAMIMAVRSKILVLTGGPGTGKTTTTLGIIKTLSALKKRILLAAPTGRAAKRLSEATGLEAKTIHRLLEVKPPNSFIHNEENPLEGDVLIVDECSMIDIILMNNLLKAIPPNMQVVFVGDTDQLPSVGPGNVLKDIINSHSFPVVQLKKIFRQAQTSRIITNAHRINRGMMPDTSNGKESDFFFIPKEEPEEISALIKELVTIILPRTYNAPAKDIQVLTPMKKTQIGTDVMNQELQALLNPSGDEINHGGKIYRVNDRVMQLRNNYNKNVFNGDVGNIISADTVDKVIQVQFDGIEEPVAYEESDLNELTHAYACTMHKSQGSEYPIVVMPVSMSHYVMLQRNLIYTGITRAKKICILVGTKKALYKGVKTQDARKRNTKLAKRISKI